MLVYPLHLGMNGTQWLSGRVLDLRPRGHGFEPHRHHCVVSLSKTHVFLLSTGSTQEDPSRHNWKIIDWDVKDQIKQTKCSKQLYCEMYCTLTDISYLNIYLYHFQDRIEGIEVQAAQFVESGHFDSDNIQAKQTQLLNRYKALQVNRKMTSINWVSKHEILTLIPNG